jgi:hypothetical protein
VGDGRDSTYTLRVGYTTQTEVPHDAAGVGRIGVMIQNDRGMAGEGGHGDHVAHGVARGKFLV